MAIFPKIQSPCPYQDRLTSIMDGDTCRMCKRQVFDLTEMSDRERVSFMQGCESEVCVSYRLPLRIAAAAVAMAALAAPMAAAAREDAPAGAETVFVVVTGGGIKDLANVQYIDEAGERVLPDLPVVYETAAAAKDAGPAASAANAAPDKPAAQTAPATKPAGAPAP